VSPERETSVRFSVASCCSGISGISGDSAAERSGPHSSVSAMAGAADVLPERPESSGGVTRSVSSMPHAAWSVSGTGGSVSGVHGGVESAAGILSCSHSAAPSVSSFQASVFPMPGAGRGSTRTPRTDNTFSEAAFAASRDARTAPTSPMTLTVMRPSPRVFSLPRIRMFAAFAAASAAVMAAGSPCVSMNPKAMRSSGMVPPPSYFPLMHQTGSTSENQWVAMQAQHFP